MRFSSISEEMAVPLRIETNDTPNPSNFIHSHPPMLSLESALQFRADSWDHFSNSVHADQNNK
jgi:hypothetical protein